jgi:hypothetical protein
MYFFLIISKKKYKNTIKITMNPQNKVRTARTTKAAPRPRHKWSCTAITAIKGKSPGKKFLEKIRKVVKSQKYKKSRKVLGLWRS